MPTRQYILGVSVYGRASNFPDKALKLEQLSVKMIGRGMPFRAHAFDKRSIAS
jgi:hypothetical protein